MVELMVTVSIAAIIMMVAIPNFDLTIKKNRIQTQLRELAGHIKLARSEAISRSVPVTVCHSNDQATCAAAPVNGDWSAGWIVFVDLNSDAVVDLGDTILRAHDDIGTNILTVTDDADPAAPINNLLFTRLGANTRATFKMCEEEGRATMARALIMELTGRLVRSADHGTSGTPGPNGIYEDVLGADLSC